MAEENVVPLDYAVIGFPGNKFNGEIAPEIYRLASEGLIEIVDIVFISKDKDGQHTSFELNDLSPEEYAQFAPLAEHWQSMLTPEDVETMASYVPADCSALVLLWKNIWTEKFRRAVKNSNGVVLAHERVPAEVLNEVMAEIKASVA
jgi:uncharacterized membrane protein